MDREGSGWENGNLTETTTTPEIIRSSFNETFAGDDDSTAASGDPVVTSNAWSDLALSVIAIGVILAIISTLYQCCTRTCTRRADGPRDDESEGPGGRNPISDFVPRERIDYVCPWADRELVNLQRGRILTWS